MVGTARRASAEADAGDGRVLLFCSPNVLDTIGRPGLLEERIGARAVDREQPRRSDVLLQDLGGSVPATPPDAPPFLVDRPSVDVEGRDVRVVVLSLEPELVGPPPWRHSESGWLVQPPSDYLTTWPQNVIDWLHENCGPEPNLDASQSLENLARITKILMKDRRCVVIFGVSTYDPTDQTHQYSPGSDSYEIRAHRIMAEFERMASDLRCTVVDVDGAVAEVGALGTVLEPCRLDAAAIEFVTEEAVLAIDQSGALGGSLQPHVMTVRVPQFDRRTTDGVVTKWHVQPGDEVTDGDVMFDVSFERERHRFDMAPKEEALRRSPRRKRSKRARKFFPLDISVVAGGDVVIHEVLAAEGQAVSVGSVAAVVTTEPSTAAGLDDASGDFRVGVRVAGS